MSQLFYIMLQCCDVLSADKHVSDSGTTKEGSWPSISAKCPNRPDTSDDACKCIMLGVQYCSDFLLGGRARTEESDAVPTRKA
jgi:hypothetical protein